MRKTGARRAPPRKRERLVTAERRAQLLELGLNAFGARPYDEISIDDLASAAGISKGLLYHYFPTKRAFYVAALRVAAERLLAETETPEDLPPIERARRGLDAYLSFAERHAKAYVTLLSGGIGADAEVTRVIDRTRRTFVERMVAGTPHDDARSRLAVRGFVGFVEATCIEWLAHRSIARDELLGLWARAILAVGAQNPSLTDVLGAAVGRG